MNTIDTERMAKAKRALKWEQLSQEHPKVQARAISDHYLAHMNAAMVISKLLNMSNGEDEAYELALQTARKIKEHHALDLGVELDWMK